MRRIAATLAVVALLFSAGSAWADFDDGLAAYERGDSARAFLEWFPYAEQGFAQAQYLVAEMYIIGEGVSKNEAEAAKWYRKAAEQGDADGQTGLGFSYALGTGVPVNNVKAYMWWSLAKAQGTEMAASNLDILKKEMNTAQIGEAQKLAAERCGKRLTTNAAPSAPPSQTVFLSARHSVPTSVTINHAPHSRHTRRRRSVAV